MSADPDPLFPPEGRSGPRPAPLAVHVPGSASWTEAALRGARLLLDGVSREMGQTMRDIVADPRRAQWLSCGLSTGLAVDPLIAMGLGPALLARTTETCLLELLRSFPRGQVLAPASDAPPAVSPAPALAVEFEPISPVAEHMAAARALMELARGRAACDAAAGLLILGAADLDGLDDEALDALDPDLPPDPVTLDVADDGGELTDVDVAVVLGERAHHGEFVRGVQDALVVLYTGRVIALGSVRPGPGLHYPGW